MKKLLVILLLASLGSQAQNIDMNIRDQWQRIWVTDLYSGNLLNRHATVYIPKGWDASNAQHYTIFAFTGDGTSGAWSDTTQDTPGHLLSNSNPYGKWNGKVIRNDGDTALFAIIQIPYYGSSAQTSGSYDVYNALVKKMVIETGQSLSTPDRKFLGMHVSGGPHRYTYSKQQASDTANAYMQKIDRVLFMSPTNGASSTMSTYYHQNGRYRVFFSKGDTNPGTTPTHAYRLRDSLARRGNNELYLDSVATGGHGSATWDKYINTTDLNDPAGTGGDATTNVLRWLIEDYAIAGNVPPIVNAGPDQTLTSSSVTLSGTASDPDGTIASYLWTKVSGTGGTIVSPSSATTNVTGLTFGTYVFSLRATDNEGAFTTDQVTITIQSNASPVANAGDDVTITLPTNQITVTGSGTDSDGTIASYFWEDISASGANVMSPTSATTLIRDIPEGSHTFKLTVTDNSGNTNSDTIQVTVNEQIITVITLKGRKARLVN